MAQGRKNGFRRIVATDALPNHYPTPNAALMAKVGSLLGSGKLTELEADSRTLQDEVAARNESIELLQQQMQRQQEEHRRKFKTDEAGFQVVKDLKDKTKLALAINGQLIGEWFKERFDKLFSSIRRNVISSRSRNGLRQ